jgi:hypothetical protein
VFSVDCEKTFSQARGKRLSFSHLETWHSGRSN